MSHPHLKTAKEDDHPVVGVGALRPAWVRSCAVQAVAALDRPAVPWCVSRWPPRLKLE